MLLFYSHYEPKVNVGFLNKNVKSSLQNITQNSVVGATHFETASEYTDVVLAKMLVNSLS